MGPDFHDTGLEIGARFPAKSSPGNRCPIWNARGGDRASDLLLTSLGPHQLRQIRVASLPIQEHLLHSHHLLPQPRRPKSKLRNPSLEFGFWNSDFGFWILDLGVWILDFGFWTLDLGFWILDCRSIHSFCGSPKRSPLDFGFWILRTVWILHKIIATTRRLGPADIDFLCLRTNENVNNFSSSDCSAPVEGLCGCVTVKLSRVVDCDVSSSCGD